MEVEWFPMVYSVELSTWQTGQQNIPHVKKMEVEWFPTAYSFELPTWQTVQQNIPQVKE